MKISLSILLFLSLISLIKTLDYYPACSSSYDSLIDALKSIGVDSSFKNRKVIAELNGIQNYSGTESQNLELLNKLKEGKLIRSSSEYSHNCIYSYYKTCCFSYDSLIDALKSIGADSSFENRKNLAKLNEISDYSGTESQNLELLNKLKQGKLIFYIYCYPEDITEPTDSEYIFTDEMSDDWATDTIIPSNDYEKIKKIEQSPKYSSKKSTLSIIGKLLLDNEFEPSFVAGVLANIYHEGNIGLFELSNYKKYKKPVYLDWMDKLYDYKNKFSGKIITQVSMKELAKVMEKCSADNWQKGMFGLGCIQWTGVRAYKLFKLYEQECNKRDKITIEEATAAEGKMIIKELLKEKIAIYQQWKKENPHKYSNVAASNAGKIICLLYEIPKDKEKKAGERAKTAQELYSIMTG